MVMMMIMMTSQEKQAHITVEEWVMTRSIYIYLHGQRLLDSHWPFFLADQHHGRRVFFSFLSRSTLNFLDHYRSYLTRLGGRDTWMPRQKSPQMDTNGDKDRRGPYSILDPGGGGRLFSLPPFGAT